MNRIKGLITKDLLQLKSYGKTLLIFILVFVSVSFLEGNRSSVELTITLMLILGFGMFSLATFNYDELAKADRYILTLPLSRKDIVLAKYILVFFSTVLGALIGILLSCILSYILNGTLPDAINIATFAISGMFGIGVVQAIQIPCIFKYGAEKGRIQRFIVIALIALLIGGILNLGEKLKINLEMGSIVSILAKYMSILLIPITLIMYYISYRISYKIFRKKEL